MKKFLALAVVAFAFAANTFAQYDRVYVSYAPTKFSESLNGSTASTKTLQGVEAGYFHGFGLTQSAPLYLELGANVQYNNKSMDGASVTLCNIKVPVNITYKAPIADNLALAPYAGINAKFNAVGDLKDPLGNKVSLYEDGNKGKRFQVGYQVGVNFYITDFYVGVGYQGDITEIGPKTRCNGLVATIGYAF